MLLLAMHHAAESANYFAVKLLCQCRQISVDTKNNEVGYHDNVCVLIPPTFFRVRHHMI